MWQERALGEIEMMPQAPPLEVGLKDQEGFDGVSVD
jgi:hypothetical protein